MKIDVTDNLFEITREGLRPNKSLTMPAAACVIGTFMIEDSANPGVAKLADGTKPVGGAVERAVIVGVPVPTFAEMAGGMIGLPAHSPYSTGEEGSLRDADEYVAEGSDYVSSVGGATDITPATAVGTKTSFRAGKTSKAATGDYSEFYIAEQLTPTVAGNTRIRLRRMAGVIV